MAAAIYLCQVLYSKVIWMNFHARNHPWSCPATAKFVLRHPLSFCIWKAIEFTGRNGVGCGDNDAISLPAFPALVLSLPCKGWWWRLSLWGCSDVLTGDRRASGAWMGCRLQLNCPSALQLPLALVSPVDKKSMSFFISKSLTARLWASLPC